MKLEITAFDIAQRFVGIKEIPGSENNQHVLTMLRLDQKWPENDEVPWCSAFVNYITWLLRLPRSKSLLARSWLNVGRPVEIENAEAGFDVVVLKRSGKNQPDADVVDAPGHVGFYAGETPGYVHVLGGNQGDAVNLRYYPYERILGIRRLV
jgi:uncharacterized protein (TIGR02594 family)